MKSVLFIVLLLAASVVPAGAQWQIQTPRESHPVPSDGSTVNFPTVSLPLGMTYHVHTDGRVNVSTGSDISDACYYVNILSFNPTITPVAMKVHYGAGLEDWVWSFLNPKNYQSSHIYDESIASTASPLSFRFFDRADPPSTYYNDNSGSITVEVAQQTPELVAKYDTVYFKNILVGSSQTVIDSIETYGLDAYQCNGITFVGPSTGKFTVLSENVVPFSLNSETTNWMQFTYTPTSIARDTAFFHFSSANVYAPQKDFVVVLIANSVGSKLSVAPDTLDFGTITIGSTKQLTENFSNSGNASATVTSITATPIAPEFSVAPQSFPLASNSSTPATVSFTPPAGGNFFATFDCVCGDGSTLRFYAKGAGGIVKSYLSDTVLDFGRLVLGQSFSLIDTLLNVGTAPLDVTSTLNSNPGEYAVNGSQGSHTYFPGSGAVYTFTFTPNHHLPDCQNHDGTFTYYFSDGSSRTIIFRGCDHQPVTTQLFIDTNYTVNIGQSISVAQLLVDPVDSTLSPTRTLSERISYDNTLFDLTSIKKGLLINSPDWQLTTTNFPGSVSILLTSTTSQLGPAGQLLVMTFKAHQTDSPGDFTLLTQDSTNFYNFEPTAVTLGGKIVVSDICSPVNLNNVLGAATYIQEIFPNPLTSTATIHYSIGQTSDGSSVAVRLQLFDVMGRPVSTLVNEPKQPGSYDVTVSRSGLPNGLYWYRFDAGSYSAERSMIVTK